LPAVSAALRAAQEMASQIFNFCPLAKIHSLLRKKNFLLHIKKGVVNLTTP